MLHECFTSGHVLHEWSRVTTGFPEYSSSRRLIGDPPTTRNCLIEMIHETALTHDMSAVPCRSEEWTCADAQFLSMTCTISCKADSRG